MNNHRCEERTVTVNPFRGCITLALISLASTALAQEQGRVEFHTITSAHLEAGGYAAVRELSVYLPPGYDQAGLGYPVIFLVHGSGGSNRIFFSGQYRVDLIADSLIAEGAMQSMILVGLDVNGAEGWEWDQLAPALGDYVVEEVLPFVESTYSVRRRRSSRGLAGWSAGGNFVVQLAFDRPDIFRAVATYAGNDPFCPSGLTREYNSWRYPFDFWLWYGRNDPGYNHSLEIVKWFDAQSLPHELYTDDGDHGSLYQPLSLSLRFFSEIFSRADRASDLPVVRSGTEHLVRSTDPAPLRFELELDKSDPDAPMLLLDLSPLGGGEVPLTHEGGGRYAYFAPAVTAPTGIHFLRVRLDGDESAVVFMARVDVLPAGDVVVVGDRLSAGWTVDNAGGAEVPVPAGPDGEGRDALAFTVEPASFVGWRATLKPPAPVVLFGFTHIRLDIHPGSATGRALNLSIGGVGVKLVDPRGDDLVDLELRDWQSVEIDLAQPRLCLGEDIEAIALNGDLEGTFFVKDLRLVAKRPEQTVTAVTGRLEGAMPAQIMLAPNYPNPSNSGTVIPFDLPRTAEVELAVFDLLGQRVATLLRGDRPAGTYTVPWDGRGDHGRNLGSGPYLYRLRVGERVETRKLLLLR